MCPLTRERAFDRLAGDQKQAFRPNYQQGDISIEVREYQRLSRRGPVAICGGCPAPRLPFQAKGNRIKLIIFESAGRFHLKRLTNLRAAIIGLLAPPSQISASALSAPEPFYKDRTISILVGYPRGGPMTRWRA